MPFLTNIPTTTTILNHHLYPNLEKMGNFILWHKKKAKKQKNKNWTVTYSLCSPVQNHTLISESIKETSISLHKILTVSLVSESSRMEDPESELLLDSTPVAEHDRTSEMRSQNMN